MVEDEPDPQVIHANNGVGVARTIVPGGVGHKHFGTPLPHSDCSALHRVPLFRPFLVRARIGGTERPTVRRRRRMGEWTFQGHGGEIAARAWPVPQPRYVAVLCHGYGEHVGRYEWVAGTLNGHGAAVYGHDHVGHGRSAGERVLVNDFDPVVDDLHALVRTAQEENRGVPVVLIGHSMGGMIAARYAQRHPGTLAALVLSGPVLGRWDVVGELLAKDPIPPTPIDPETLSRDPEVGRAYAADPLVWHGDFRRETLEAIQETLSAIGTGGSVGDLPLLYLHGEADTLVPPGPSLEGLEAIRGSHTESRTFPGLRHEIFNETTKAEVLGDVTSFVDRVLAGELDAVTVGADRR
jgi:alpha-beta hydrolase superfamily lysophospholipase